MTFKSILLTMAATAFSALATASTSDGVSGNYSNNRQPLLQKTYIELPIGAIKAEGWMQEQLIRMKMA